MEAVAQLVEQRKNLSLSLYFYSWSNIFYFQLLVPCVAGSSPACFPKNIGQNQLTSAVRQIMEQIKVVIIILFLLLF
ncbi:MAG: hypothetical protein EAZ85_14705 [Bacteroidetes bacterium]|nr:MAG: hypothetical protein EAZ85_14705 [Bacteroidota bacterium]